MAEQPRGPAGTTDVSTKTGLNVYVIGGPASGAITVQDAAFSTELTGDITGTTTQVKICVGADDLASRRLLVIQNTGTLRIWVGPSGVDAGGTTDPGIWLNPGDIARWTGALAAITRYAISTGSFSAAVQEAA